MKNAENNPYYYLVAKAEYLAGYDCVSCYLDGNRIEQHHLDRIADDANELAADEAITDMGTITYCDVLQWVDPSGKFDYWPEGYDSYEEYWAAEEDGEYEDPLHMIDTIKIPTLKELVKAGADLHLNAIPVTGGFSLTIKTKAGTRMLSAKRGNLRVFKKLDAIVSVLEQVGLTTTFEFNLTQ